MDRLPTIPSPASHLWREFRINVFPGLLFIGLAVLVVVMWKTNLGSPTAEGEVEAIRTDIISTAEGTLTRLDVERFQAVTNGAVLAVVAKMDPGTMKASLAVIEADLKLMRARMALDVERNVLNREQMRLDLLTRKVDLANRRIQLRQAESEFERVSKLYADKLTAPGVSPDGTPGYEVALRDRDALRSDVAEMERIVTDLEATLGRLGREFSPLAPGSKEDAIAAAIDAQERQLKQVEEDLVLRAPMDGIVSSINAMSGQKVMPGTAIATISVPKSRQIIGYLRQPLPIEPIPGMAVEIRTRGAVRQVGQSKITRVGSDMQLVAAPLRVRGFANAQERGLPFTVYLPPDLNVRPGELVDLIFRP